VSLFGAGATAGVAEVSGAGCSTAGRAVPPFDAAGSAASTNCGSVSTVIITIAKSAIFFFNLITYSFPAHAHHSAVPPFAAPRLLGRSSQRPIFSLLFHNFC
jgi:hypothetical protein